MRLRGIDPLRIGGCKDFFPGAPARRLLLLSAAILLTLPAMAQIQGYSIGAALDPGSSPVLLEVDLTTSSVERAGVLDIPGPFIAAGLARDQSGALFSISKEALFSLGGKSRALWNIDPETLGSRWVGTIDFPVGAGPTGLTFDACGRLWLSARSPVREESRLLELDPATGEILSEIRLSHRIQGLAAEGETLFTWVEVEFAEFSLGAIDLASGRLRIFPPTTVPRGVMSLDFGPSGQLWGILAIETTLPFPSLVYRLNEATGRADLRGKISPPLFGLALGPAEGECVSRSVVEVPTLGLEGAVGLVLLLTLAAFRLLGPPDLRGRQEEASWRKLRP